jgi:hypothetical protein
MVNTTSEGLASPTVSVIKKTAMKKKVQAEDTLVEICHTIEAATSGTAFQRVRDLLEEVEMNGFVVGGYLAMILEQGWWDTGQYKSFRDMVETEFGVAYRKAMYLIEIYHGLVISGVTWDQVKAIGWTKLKEIVGLLTTDNADVWVERAKNMTVLQLIAYVKQMKSANAAGGEVEITAQPSMQEKQEVTTMTFKLHADQKETVRQALDKVKSEQDTQFDSVALEWMALQYLEGSLGKKVPSKAQKTLAEQMTDAGLEEVFTVFEQVFPNVNVTVEEV